ncbi:MAG: archaetidylserine decarboxylase [Wenzhouxiangellaceae bacterium]
MIAGFRRFFPVDMSECVQPEDGFATFDQFFTRALREGARDWPAEPGVIASPCDGTLSQLGPIRDGRIFQAKGRDYSAAELLADAELAEAFSNGRFATIYLAPHDYHRVHMPFGGRLVRELRVPGRLFSVSAATTGVIDRLFARNERMVAVFETDYGPAAVVMVAAMLVAGIETVWDPAGRLRPARDVQRFDFESGPQLARGDELGRFHWGSTVIMLTPPDAPDWLPALAGGQRMRVGQPMSAADS